MHRGRITDTARHSTRYSPKLRLTSSRSTIPPVTHISTCRADLGTHIAHIEGGQDWRQLGKPRALIYLSTSSLGCQSRTSIRSLQTTSINLEHANLTFRPITSHPQTSIPESRPRLSFPWSEPCVSPSSPSLVSFQRHASLFFRK